MLVHFVSHLPIHSLCFRLELFDNDNVISLSFQKTTQSFEENVSSSLLENTTTTENEDFNSPLLPIIELKSVLYCAVWPTICSVGIVGNILTLIVLSKVKDSSTALQYLKSLAVSDILTIAIKCVFASLILGQLFWPDEYLTWTVRSFSFLLCNPTEKISKCITVLIVLDRVVAVTSPFKYKAICTPLRTTVAIVAICLLVVATTSPYVVEAFRYDFQTEGNRTIEPSSEKEAAHFLSHVFNTSKALSINIAINRFLFDVLPIPIVLVGNIIIIIGLRRSSSVKPTSEDAGNQRKYQERQLTKLLLFVSIAFLVLCAPYDMLVLFTLIKGSGSVAPLAHFLHEIFRTLTLTNNSINFVIYAVMNKRYRQAYKSILMCCRRETGHGTLQTVENNQQKSP